MATKKTRRGISVRRGFTPSGNRMPWTKWKGPTQNFVEGDHSYKYVIRRGLADSRFDACLHNALENCVALLEKANKGERPKEFATAKVVVGSMGFHEDPKTHWEYGHPGWSQISQFQKAGGLWDAHVWVEYVDSEGTTVIIDPDFPQHETICEDHGMSPATAKDGRVYAEAPEWIQSLLLWKMTTATIERARDTGMSVGMNLSPMEKARLMS